MRGCLLGYAVAFYPLLSFGYGPRLLRLLSVRLGVGERPVVSPLCGVGPILLIGLNPFLGRSLYSSGHGWGSPRMHLDHADLQSRCGFSKSTFIGRKAPPLATELLSSVALRNRTMVTYRNPSSMNKAELLSFGPLLNPVLAEDFVIGAVCRAHRLI